MHICFCVHRVYFDEFYYKFYKNTIAKYFVLNDCIVCTIIFAI